jgi:hypothetical protein
MPVGVLWKVVRTWYDGRMDPQPMTRTVEDKQRLLIDAGLTGPFWTLPR